MSISMSIDAFVQRVSKKNCFAELCQYGKMYKMFFKSLLNATFLDMIQIIFKNMPFTEKKIGYASFQLFFVKIKKMRKI